MKTNIKNSILNRKSFFKKKNKYFVTFLQKRFNMSNLKINFSTPLFWNFVFFKNKLNNNLFFYFFNKNYFFLLPVPSNFLNIKFDKSNKGFILFFNYSNNFFKIFFFFFKTLFKSFSCFFFIKLKFRGKGYYIYKNKRNTIAFKFGYSHIKRVFFFSSHVKFLSKTLIIIYGINKNFIFSNAFKFFKVRPINIFTGKGIRFTRQIIYKKAGKISSYR